MSERTHLLVRQWLQQAMPQASTDDLANLTERYPYFSAAQLLLFRRLSEGGSKLQKGKAALHVYNPLLLETDDTEKMFQFPIEAENGIEPLETENIAQKENETFFAEPEVPEMVAAEPVVQQDHFSEAGEENFSAQTEDNTIKEPGATVIDEEVLIPEADETNFSETKEEITNERKEEDFIVNEKEPDDFTSESPAPAPSISLPHFNLNAPPTPTAGDITFEPFHTVDYFASQGIKLSQASETGDKFGRQVKTFTEWLKTMKKLPTTAVTANTDNAGEKKVENLAAHSLQNTDIITESMAEVWVKQGNIQKASEVYNKLSLQNPSKKAYFAAKIESLKKPS